MTGREWEEQYLNASWERSLRCVPSLDLVFVRLGDGKRLPKDWEAELVAKILAAITR